MLDWRKPEISDRSWVAEAAEGSMGCDLSFGNIYLLQHIYDTEICRAHGSFLRRFRGSDGGIEYGFPIGGDHAAALREIESEADAVGQRAVFSYLTEDLREKLESASPGRFEFSSDDGSSDYIYAREDLASLKGRSYQKKRNRLSKFMRTYPDAELRPLTTSNSGDAMRAADLWFAEQRAGVDQTGERLAIEQAVHRCDELGIVGYVLYVFGEPVGMTAGSPINTSVFDVHFEKAAGPSAEAGAYSFINKALASSVDAEWLNREEDLGDLGIRRAKLSYCPRIILKKYTARER